MGGGTEIMFKFTSSRGKHEWYGEDQVTTFLVHVLFLLAERFEMGEGNI